MNIELLRIGTNFKGNFCYVHTRGAMFPDGYTVITTQPLRLSGSDIFYGIELMTSPDGGQNWSEIRKSANLKRKELADGCMQAFCDATPMYHKKSGKMLLLGGDVIYRNDEIHENPFPRCTLWSIFDREKDDWEPFRSIAMPDDDKYFCCRNGSGQSLELDNGDLLIPVYFMSRKDTENPWNNLYHVSIMRCSFDGSELKLLEIGNSITVPEPRGLCEPSIVYFGDRYYVTLRNDKRGYVTFSNDGLNLAEPVPLIFDDGSESGNYCTQQHWFVCDGILFMVYTRSGADNDHVFRHRAPLFFAEFDVKRMCLIRSTEQIAVPNRGARLGNFGCTSISADESWVIASEWMQTNPPNPFDWNICMKYGSDNSIFIARIRKS